MEIRQHEPGKATANEHAYMYRQTDRLTEKQREKTKRRESRVRVKQSSEQRLASQLAGSRLSARGDAEALGQGHWHETGECEQQGRGRMNVCGFALSASRGDLWGHLSARCRFNITCKPCRTRLFCLPLHSSKAHLLPLGSSNGVVAFLDGSRQVARQMHSYDAYGDMRR